MLGFTLVVSLATGVVFGLFPALHSSKTDLTESLKEGGRGSTAARVTTRMRSGLVIAEVAIAVVLWWRGPPDSKPFDAAASQAGIRSAYLLV